MSDEQRWTIYKQTGVWDDVIEGPDTHTREQWAIETFGGGDPKGVIVTPVSDAAESRRAIWKAISELHDLLLDLNDGPWGITSDPVLGIQNVIDLTLKPALDDDSSSGSRATATEDVAEGGGGS